MALKRQHNEARQEMGVYQRLYQPLSSVSETEAGSILRVIRRSGDATTIVLQAEGSNLLQLGLARGARRRYEFLYRPAMLEHHLLPINSYAYSEIYEAMSINQPMASAPAGEYSKSPHRSVYLTPYHAALLDEPLVADAKVPGWTMITSDDEYLRSILRGHLLHYHPTYPSFHEDIVFRTLPDGDERFCSPLLANAGRRLCIPHTQPP